MKPRSRTALAALLCLCLPYAVVCLMQGVRSLKGCFVVLCFDFFGYLRSAKLTKAIVSCIGEVYKACCVSFNAVSGVWTQCLSTSGTLIFNLWSLCSDIMLTPKSSLPEILCFSLLSQTYLWRPRRLLGQPSPPAQATLCKIDKKRAQSDRCQSLISQSSRHVAQTTSDVRVLTSACL